VQRRARLRCTDGPNRSTCRSEASEPLRESIERAERAVFHATEGDTELLRFRATDLTLGAAAAFEAFLGDDPRLQVWPLDEGGKPRS